MNAPAPPSDFQERCRNRAFYAYGTSRLFERRAHALARKRNAITFLGIAIPLVVGGVVLSFGALPTLLPYLIGIAGVLGIVQLVLSVWSVVAHWDMQYAHALAAAQGNTRLYNAWDALLKRPPRDWQERAKELDAEDQRQEQSDLTQHVTDAEKRFAMRSALFYWKLPCSTCTKVPASMKASDCDMCGNF